MKTTIVNNREGLLLEEFYTRDLKVADYIHEPIIRLLDHPQFNSDVLASVSAMCNLTSEEYKTQKGIK